LRAALESQVVKPEPIKLVNQVPQPRTRINWSQVVLSQTVLPTNNNRQVIELPSKAQREALIASGIHDLWLYAFENNNGGTAFNFVLSNGMKTNQKDPNTNYTLFNMHEDTHKKTRKVQIYTNGLNVCGFKFFDKNSVQLFRVGYFRNEFEEVAIEENQQIIGIVARLAQGFNSAYTDF
jgi:hypothetical protein